MSATPHATHCPSCGQEYAADALFCPACGTPRSRDASGDPLMGMVLGQRFLILERLGHGASGTIYRGEHVTLRRKVAIKVLHQELSRDELAVERFRREATTVSEIDNEHIVEIFDFGRTDDGRLYLAMELLEGETLQDRLTRDKRLPVDQAVDILIQLGEALMEAHAMGYIHRDLRPRNIYLARRRGRANFVKLLDFGLAKLVESEGEAESTSLGMTFGDPRYMSPEQASGEPLDRRADIYSLGCIAYEMLVGQAPFATGKLFDILTQQVDAAPPEPRARRAEVPEWLSSAITCMLAKRPQDRFITVYRLIEALRQGQQTGETMPVEIARKAETALPVAVSLAVPSTAEQERAQSPRPDAAETPEDREGDEDQAPDQEDQEDQADEAEADQAETQPVATVAGKSGRTARAEDSMSGLSGAWFAERESGDDLDEDARAQLDDARSRLAAGDSSAGDDLYYDPSRKPLAKIAAIAGGVVVLIIILAVAWPSGNSSKKGSEDQSSPPATADALARMDQGGDTDPDATGLDRGAHVAIDAGAENPAAGHTTSDPDTSVATASQVGKDTSGQDASKDTAGKDGSKDGSKTGKDGASKSGKDTSAKVRAGRDGSADPSGELRDPFMNPLGRDQGKDSSGGSHDSKQAAFFAKLGDSNLRNGDIQSALGNFKKALDLDPGNADAVIGQGEIALRTGSHAAAIKHLKKAVRMRPGSAPAHTLLGEAYLSTGKDSDAAASFKRALKIDPDNARARDGYNEAAGKAPSRPGGAE